MKYVGATETYDPAFVENLDQNLKEANIIITKRLTDDMIKKLMENKDKCILHHTVTGLGGTIYEPGVNNPKIECLQAMKLLKAGFPTSQYVLRIDPIIPTSRDNFIAVSDVLCYWIDFIIKPLNIGTLRCRISIIDQYSHVAKRFKDAGVEIPWKGFHAPKEAFIAVAGVLKSFRIWYHFETCAELGFSDYDWISQVGCASYDDLKKLAVDLKDYGFPEQNQRAQCRCLAKKQILKVKPGRCNHRCLYCYWKDDAPIKVWDGSIDVEVDPNVNYL